MCDYIIHTLAACVRSRYVYYNVLNIKQFLLYKVYNDSYKVQGKIIPLV